MTSTNPKKKTKQAIPGLPKIDKRVVSIGDDEKLSQASIQSITSTASCYERTDKSF
tara:strand:+ start:586 stop:753 length:168 start_codon:yes stop_codon:yes gene_type:complete